MKFWCNETPKAKRERLEKIKHEKYHYLADWHLKFAWLPVQLENGQCAWLEYVHRKGTHWMKWQWMYKEAPEVITYY